MTAGPDSNGPIPSPSPFQDCFLASTRPRWAALTVASPHSLWYIGGTEVQIAQTHPLDGVPMAPARFY